MNSDLTMLSLKKELHRQCLDYAEKRINAAQLAIDEAQKASNDDTKSSAGDKYETGRAMMEQETDRNMGQLTEANKLKVILNKINQQIPFSIIVYGEKKHMFKKWDSSVEESFFSHSVIETSDIYIHVYIIMINE